MLSIGLNAQNVLVVQRTDQTEQNFDIGENGYIFLNEANDETPGYVSIVDNGNTVTNIYFEDIQKMYFSSVLSISTVENMSNVILYPNPANDYIKTAGGGLGKRNVMIYSLDGKLLVQGQYSEDEKIDISYFEKGMYIIKINDRTFKFSKL